MTILELSGDPTKSNGPSFDPIRVIIVSEGSHFKRTFDMDNLNLNKIFEVQINHNFISILIIVRLDAFKLII